MKVIDRHLAGQFWRWCAAATALFLALFLVVELFEKLRLILKYHPQASDMALFFAARTPWMLSQVLPMAALLATLLSLVVLGRHGEITALRAGGIPVTRMARPFVAAGLVLAAVTGLVQEVAAPRGFALAREVKEVRIKGRSPRSLLRTTDLWLRSGDRILHVDRLGASERELLGVQVAELRGHRIARRLDARRAVWADGGWVLEDVEERSFGEDGSIRSRREDRVPYPLGLRPEDLRIEKEKPEALSSVEILRRIRRHRARGLDTRDLEVGLWAKTAAPFTCALMPLLAFPFGLRSARRQGAGGAVVGTLALGFGFFLLQAVALSLGRAGFLPPPAAAWAGPAVFLALATALLARAERA